MRVLTLVPNVKNFAPGQRGSIELWESVLAAEGIYLDFAPFESERLHQILYQPGRQIEKAAEMMRGYVERFGLLNKLSEYDAVFVYREAALLGPAFFERLIARRKPIIYQLDDPLFVPYRSPSNGLLSHLKFFGKIKEIIRLSRVVMVNSTHIREYAEQFNKNIWQIPSIVDTAQKFVYQPFAADLERVCVGWSGSPTTIKNVNLVGGALGRLAQTVDHDVHLIGGTDFGLPAEVKYTAQKWSAETEVADLRRMQIGMIPIPRTHAWNKYKFYMKSAQYMALGIVPVGTPVGSNPEAIRHGENGFLADTDDEWVEYISLLVRDRDLLNRLSAQAAQDAQEKYSLKANAPKVIEAFRASVK